MSRLKIKKLLLRCVDYQISYYLSIFHQKKQKKKPKEKSTCAHFYRKWCSVYQSRAETTKKKKRKVSKKKKQKKRNQRHNFVIWLMCILLVAQVEYLMTTMMSNLFSRFIFLFLFFVEYFLFCSHFDYIWIDVCQFLFHLLGARYSSPQSFLSKIVFRVESNCCHYVFFFFFILFLASFFGSGTFFLHFVARLFHLLFFFLIISLQKERKTKRFAFAWVAYIYEWSVFRIGFSDF